MDASVAVGGIVTPPPKPSLGDPCNGCGVCCLAECCPLGIVLFRRRQGPCPALRWDEGSSRHLCGIVADPKHYLGWLPQRWGRALASRWIAAGMGCDSSADLMER
jgi:hypothetical protein